MTTLLHLTAQVTQLPLFLLLWGLRLLLALLLPAPPTLLLTPAALFLVLWGALFAQFAPATTTS